MCNADASTIPQHSVRKGILDTPVSYKDSQQVKAAKQTTLHDYTNREGSWSLEESTGAGSKDDKIPRRNNKCVWLDEDNVTWQRAI